MPKRKRDSPSADTAEASDSRVLKQRKKLFAQRLAAAQKPLLSALRHAATLERQKFSRRKKGAKTSNNDKASQRLEVEYATLKTLDLAKVAEQHLKKVIQRVKSLRECDALPESAKIAPGAGGAEKDLAALNVQARLFKVDGVRKIVDEVIEDLKIIVGVGKGGVEGEKMAKKDKEERDTKKTKRDVDEEEDSEGEAEAQEFDSDALAAFDARIAAPSSADEESDESLSDGHRPQSIAESESEDDAEEEPLASDCDGDPTAFDISQNEEGATDLSDSDSHAINDSALDSDSDSDAISIPVPKPKKKAIAAPPAISGNSTFMPSLSLAAAFYSGSDSDASDIEGVDVAPVRKNRRGQRARQKIWEKKYGEKAKHKEKEDRSKGWDAKKGAVGDKKGKKQKAYGPEKSGENAIPLGKKEKKETKRDDVGDLHPSWAAAKKAKEMKSMIKIAKEGGGAKKIVFD